MVLDKKGFNFLKQSYITLNTDFIEKLKEEGLNDNSIDDIISDEVLNKVDKF